MSTCCRCGAAAPDPLENRPGLGALSYRVGNHGTFFAAMRARLSSQQFPALAGLTTHDVADPSVALLDAWAAVGDVLTFYQERIANEGYLRTATERRSVLEQARLVGYRPRPGVAADVYLAYTIDDNAGPVEIPAGARVNSVPGPGEQMQTFETSEPLEARAEWNELRVRTAQPQTGASILGQGLYLAGTATGLSVGDPLLVDLGVGRGLEPFRVHTVEPDAAADRTRVELRTWAGDDPARTLVASTLRRVTDVDRFGVDPGGATTTRVLAALTALAADDRAGLADRLDTALAVVGDEHDEAVRNGWARLVPWLGRAVTDLVGLRRLVSPAPAPERRAARVAARPPREGFAALLDRLQAPPSLPPRDSRRLLRSVDTAFAAGADTFPALLGSFAPAAQPALYAALGQADAMPTRVRVIALRDAAPLFGAGAPPQLALDDNGRPQRQPWPEWDPAFDEADDVAFLDREHPGVTVGSPVLVVRPESESFPATLVTSVAVVAEVVRSAYGVTARTTRLQLRDKWWHPPNDGQEGPEWDQFDVLRATTVYCRPEELGLADGPLDDDVCDGELELARLYDGLRSGRWMIVSGERVDVPGTSGVRASERVMLAEVAQRVKLVDGVDDEGRPTQEPLPGDTLHTFVTFAAPPAYCYRRGSVVLHGNVVHATHGESRREVLGGGDATTPLQTFTLKQFPLTHIAAPTSSGTASTLEVRVGDIAWHEADSIVDLGPASRGYLTADDDASRTSVVFGDGEQGSRLPTGQENITATYRNGIGSPGNVAADALSLLASRPLGVKAVTNPLRASGGADRDGRDQIRRNAPLGVAALDRLVSTRDYADFALTFAGIGKAEATRLTDGTRTLVHLTIAGASDIPIDVTSDLYRNLVVALRRFGDPHLPVRVDVRELLALVVSASVRVQPDHAWETVEPALRARLLEVFGFDRRELGQDVLPAEVVATMQGVRGVDFVDLDVLRSIDEDTVVGQLAAASAPGPAAASVPAVVAGPARPGRIEVSPARVVGAAIRPAQLAFLVPGVQDSLILNEVAP